MKRNIEKTICLFLLSFLFSRTHGQAIAWQWAQNAVTSGLNYAELGSMASDSNGNVYVGGNYEGGASFGNVNMLANGYFLVKYDSNGNIGWAKSNPFVGTARIRAITTDEMGNVYVVAFYYVNMQIDQVMLSTLGCGLGLIKLNSQGSVEWAKTIANSDNLSNLTTRGIQVDNSGNVFISGRYKSDTPTYFGGIELPSTVSENLFVLKCNASGITQWVRSVDIGMPSIDHVMSCLTDHEGNIYLTTTFRKEILSVDNKSINNSGETDVALIKFNASGNAEWLARIGGNGKEMAYGLDLDNQNNLYVTGSFASPTTTFGNDVTLTRNGDINMFIAKFTSDGISSWAMNGAGGVHDEATSVKVDSNNNVYVSGFYWSPTFSIGGYTVTNESYGNSFIIKIEEDGNLQWIQNLGGGSGQPAFNEAHFIDLTNDNHLVVSGTLYKEMKIGNFTLSNSGSQTMFVAKLNLTLLDNPMNFKQTFSVFPNPAAETISIAEDIFDGEAYEILDFSGRVVQKGSVSDKSVNVSILPAGVYFISLDGAVQKFVKK